MDNRKNILAVLTLLACAWAAYAGDVGAAAAPPSSQPAVPEITECLVYSESDKSKQHDCLAQARASCTQNGPTCELPIGLALTNNEQIDGDAKSWKKVRVRYRCNQVERVNGPHTQDDHATMILSCLGR